MTISNVWMQQYQSPVGTMTAGATQAGVCYLSWDDPQDPGRAERRILKRHGSRIIKRNNNHLDQLAIELDNYYAGKLKAFDLKLDMAGTEFERTVWSQLTTIPYGETRSYGQIAAGIERPGAARAVGRANGANPVVLVVPCHRVIAADGSLHGFGSGVWRKAFLLELESGSVPRI